MSECTAASRDDEPASWRIGNRAAATCVNSRRFSASLPLFDDNCRWPIPYEFRPEVDLRAVVVYRDTAEWSIKTELTSSNAHQSVVFPPSGDGGYLSIQH
jgi:peptide methionine sulfoxide reductase MsrB